MLRLVDISSRAFGALWQGREPSQWQQRRDGHISATGPISPVGPGRRCLAGHAVVTG
jgi:hypothetical protein